MSSSVTFAAVSAANNAAAQAAAHQAKVERCTVEVSQFVNAGSDIDAKRSFADCVSTLWPDALSSGETTMIKIAIVLMFISLAVGVVLGWREDGVLGSVMFGLLAPTLVAVALAVIALIFVGIGFLFI